MRKFKVIKYEEASIEAAELNALNRQKEEVRTRNIEAYRLQESKLKTDYAKSLKKALSSSILETKSMLEGERLQKLLLKQTSITRLDPISSTKVASH